MSSDGVEKGIDIKIVDPDSLTREERVVARAKKLAEAAEAIEKRLKKTKGGLTSGVGAPIQGGVGGFVPGAVGTSFPGGKIPAGGLAAGVAPVTKGNEFLKLRDKVAELEKSDNDQSLFIEGLSAKVSEFSGALRNPGDFVLTAITQLGGRTLVRVLGGVGAIILLATVIFGIIKKNFEAGGVFDIRKIIKDEALTISDLKTLLEIRNGQIYFSADTRVGQRVVQNSSTESLSIASQRYNELILGSSLSP